MKKTKNDMINDIIAGLTYTLNGEQTEVVRATFICKMQGYDIHQISYLPAVGVIDNDFILKRFVIDMIAKGTKQRSIGTFMNILKQFFGTVNKDFRDVTAQDITDYLAVKKITKTDKGRLLSHNYIATISCTLFIFFQWAYRRHHIETDIMLDVDRIRPKQKKKERLTPEEMESCREKLSSERETALFELMLSTGMRVGEIAKLRIEDIDLQSRKINIHGEKSENSDRVGYMSIKARNAMIRYIGERKEGYVFRPYKNSVNESKPISNGTIEKWAKEIGKRGGAHCITTVHIFRKTFASETYRRTKDVKLVSILLGHASTTITEKYYLIEDMKDIEYQARAALG